MTRVYDLVVVLYGGRAPYILQQIPASPEAAGAEGGRSQTRFQLVGECFLQGYMYGLATEQPEGSTRPFAEEVFDLL